MPHLHELPPEMQEQVMKAWQQTTNRTPNLPHFPLPPT